MTSLSTVRGQQMAAPPSSRPVGGDPVAAPRAEVGCTGPALTARLDRPYRYQRLVFGPLSFCANPVRFLLRSRVHIARAEADRTELGAAAMVS
jgi:hypothetical protein